MTIVSLINKLTDILEHRGDLRVSAGHWGMDGSGSVVGEEVCEVDVKQVHQEEVVFLLPNEIVEAAPGRTHDDR